MLTLPPPTRPLPGRADREDAGKRIEGALVADHRAILGLPPVAREEPRHHPIAASTVPHELAAGLEHPRELRNDPRIVRRLDEEPKRGEEIDDGIEAPGPRRGQTTHVATPVAKRTSRAALLRDGEQVRRIVQSIDVEPGLCEEMCMASLAAWNVQQA